MPLASTILFSFTLFLASALFFTVQLMVGRAVLPLLGGTPSVWTTCMLFFQLTLLLGYVCAHLFEAAPIRRFGIAAQASLVLLSLLAMPVGLAQDLSGGIETGRPVLFLFARLTQSVGIPALVLAATAPSLQAWFGRGGAQRDSDPYFLYAASNLGSLLGLAIYPVGIEPYASLQEQACAWSWLYGAFAAGVLGCAVISLFRAPRTVTPDQEQHDSSQREISGGSPGGFGRWLILALVPSSLTLGVTTHITTDLASVPLLWVLPLSLYLLSYVVAFSPGLAPVTAVCRRLLPWVSVGTAVALGVGLVQLFWIPIHLLFLFVASTACHGELARIRPPVQRLTWFYLAISVGGVLGGVFNAIVAPMVFPGIAEYPIGLIAALLVLATPLSAPVRMPEGRRGWILPLIVLILASILTTNPGDIAATTVGAIVTVAVSGLSLLALLEHRKRPLTFALTLGSLLLASCLSPGVNGRLLTRDRNFFGVLRVTEVGQGDYHRLFHGSTLHGQQSMEAGRQREPLTYFTESGPIGDVFRAFHRMDRSGKPRSNIAVTGLGIGTLATYAVPGENWSFFEIDPSVVRVATDPHYFTYLSESRATAITHHVGDARLNLAEQPDGVFSLMILDAFSSDAIPVHLLTREALQMYRRKLEPGGWLVCNITNRYLDLAPVVARLAEDGGWTCRVCVDASPSREELIAGKQGSIWAVLARSPSEIDELSRIPRWFEPAARPGDRVWTDDYSTLFRHLRWSRSGRAR